MIQNLRPFFLVLIATFAWGCGTKSSCLQYAMEICDSCSMSDSERDKKCACLEDGEVRNGSKYFNSRSDAEVYCADLKASFESKHMSDDQLAQCEGKLDVMKKYSDDACELFGYRSGGGYDSGGYDYGYGYGYGYGYYDY